MGQNGAVRNRRIGVGQPRSVRDSQYVLAQGLRFFSPRNLGMPVKSTPIVGLVSGFFPAQMGLMHAGMHFFLWIDYWMSSTD